MIIHIFFVISGSTEEIAREKAAKNFGVSKEKISLRQGKLLNTKHFG